jgi:transposase
MGRTPGEAVKTEAVSWAAPGSNFTHAFEERIAYLAQQSSQTAVTMLMRTTWRTVGRIINRVVGAKLDTSPPPVSG